MPTKTFYAVFKNGFNLVFGSIHTYEFRKKKDIFKNSAAIEHFFAI